MKASAIPAVNVILLQHEQGVESGTRNVNMGTMEKNKDSDSDSSNVTKKCIHLQAFPFKVQFSRKFFFPYKA